MNFVMSKFIKSCFLKKFQLPIILKITIKQISRIDFASDIIEIIYHSVSDDDITDLLEINYVFDHFELTEGIFTLFNYR